nr:tetratricopeptide repeat protein [Stackebrandtia nassauensis]
MIPQQLPADISTFTGRAREVAALLDASREGGSIVVTALDGMAGIGKTTLAVHIAHQLAPHFPDGQLFIDLHGFSGEVAPVTAAEALDRMLRALGVDAQQIPGHIDDRAALFRSVLSGKRVLLLLDNAAGEQQIRPLLPGTPGNLALITSRRRFGELDDARLVSLGLLSVEHGVDFFVRASGLRKPDAAQLDVIGRIVEQCGRLPLAIRIAAHQLRRRSSWTLDELHVRLSHESRRLETLSVRDRSVSAAFHISYQDLDVEQQRTFRMLSVFPQPLFDAQAAATVADIPLHTAQRQLDDMVDAHLLDSPQPGVYTFHDLMRQFAAAASRHVETDTGREAASFRLLDSYRNSAFAASAKLTTRLRAEPGPDSPAAAMEPPTGDVDFGHGEQPSPEAAIAKAIELGVDTHMWQIGDVARELAVDRGRAELLTLLERATESCEAASDPMARAIALNNLAATHLLLNQYPEAIENFERSLRTREELGDVRGQAAVLNSLGVAHSQLGSLDAAASCFDRAMACAFQAGADQTEAHAITNYVILADYLDMHEQALPLLNRARDIFSRNAHPRQQARLSFCFGVVYGGLGQPDRALKHLHRARQSAEESSEHFDLSHVLTAIAVNQRRLGNHADAVVSHRKAIRAGVLADDEGLKARNLIEFGRTRLALREYDAALDNFRKGARLAATATYRYEQARAEHGLADCHKALGDMVKAESHLRECVRIYTDMGAPVARELRKRLATASS